MLIGIAPNVRVYTTFCGGLIGHCVAMTAATKCGWSEPWERSDLGERNPEERSDVAYKLC